MLFNNTKQAGWSWLSFIATLFSLVFIALGSFFIFLKSIAKNLPPVEELMHFKPPIVSTVIADTHGKQTLIGEFFKERRIIVDFEQIPDSVIKAFINAEDEHFFTHSGIQFSSILRAAIANFRARHVVQGGSTITQQIAKALLLSPEKSFQRKIKEILLAFRIEQSLTKEQVLFLYLNHIYLGHGNYGVAAACESYFGKPLSQITLPEAALLAGLPQAPGKYNPLTNPKKAKERQTYVLRRLFENKIISEAQMQKAHAQPLRIYASHDINHKSAPFMVEHIRRYLLDKYGEKALYEEGLKTITSVHPELSQKAQLSIQKGLKAIDQRQGFRGPLQHFTQQKQMDQYRKHQHKKLLQNILGYQHLTPEGNLDLESAFHAAGYASLLDGIALDQSVDAVILKIDPQQQHCTLGIGESTGTLLWTTSLWALKTLDPATLERKKPFPKHLQDVLSIGDTIKVKRIGDLKNAFFTLDQDPLTQGALLSFDLETGNVIAMVGGYDFSKSEFNRATQASRQMGSAFKPIIYATALENGYTPATIIVDSPLVFKDATGVAWKPNNYEEKFYGDTTFRQALIKSRNIPTIKITQQLGVAKVNEAAKRYGLTGTFPLNLSTALGSISVPLIELAKAYAIFPRLGKKIDLLFFNTLYSQEGDILEKKTPSQAFLPYTPAKASDPNQIIDPKIAFIMTHLMNEVVLFGTGHRAKELNQTTAGKTGTTNDAIDAWFFGYTPRILTAVWVGNDTQRTLGIGETGAKAALPIWLDFMKAAVVEYPTSKDFFIPEGIIFANIDATTGKLATKKFSQSIREAFIQGTEPKALDPAEKRKIHSKEDFFKEDTD